jgi:benzylsuccinate CoA-transferase BbsF subunit
MKKLLEGIRIIDITGHVTGPLSTQAFADLGAEVIKIDTRTRVTPGPGPGGGLGGGLQRTSSKLSVTLNFTTPKGLEVTRRLVAKSDILVENLSGGTLARRGLGYEDLKKVKPDIIMLSTCMQGQTGPFSRHAATGHKLTGLAGFGEIMGWPDREPGYIGAYTDFIAPRYNIIAILAALEYRRQTGKGQFLDMSQLEPSIHFMAPLILDYDVNRRVAGRMGNQCAYAAPHNVYQCRGKDRWCAITVFTDEEWASCCRVIGNPALTEDSRFSTLLGRKDNEGELDGLVTEWTIKRQAEEVMSLMQAAGVPAGVVETAEDQLDYDPQLNHRQFFRELEHPVAKKYRTPLGTHFLLSKYEFQPKRAPLLGEHNEYVFKDILGMSDAEYEGLVEEKVID